jgi:hypothetical protein
MIVNEKQHIDPQESLLAIAWRNPVAQVRARMRTREKENPYCRWSEQARKIRARRSNWHSNNDWVE